MAVPKIIWESDKKDSLIHDKKKVEALKERLNKLIQSDIKLQKKAALIIEDWLNKKTKR
jgi:hypothetical protein